MNTLSARGGRLAFLVALACAALVAPARADFTPDTLISGSSTVEADYAFDPAISADGRYVGFTGSEAGVAGVYRKDLQTGALDLVAAGDAGAPSISSDGRFVSFTTTATDPSAGTGTQCSSVYVRDMAAPATAAAYTLASALDGGSTGLTYGGSGSAGCPGGGSSAAPRVALSADGREVAFTVVGASNLMTGSRGATTTPPAQVVVRNLDTLATTLVSQTAASLGAAPQPVPSGAAMTDNSTGVGRFAGTANAGSGDSTAAISADATTVAWLGINIPAQAAADPSLDSPMSYAKEYDEPLWRRIADGAAAPTLRVIGGDDPTGPCPGGCVGPLDTQWTGIGGISPQNVGPERGSFIAQNGFLGATVVTGSGLSGVTPQLTADGRTVALLSTQPATGQDPVYSTHVPSSPSTNAYVVNMASGLSRSQALTRITAWGSDNFDSAPLAGPLSQISISPEGDRVAFITARTAFPYSPPALITEQLGQVPFEQLYVADLGDGTLQLASYGYDGQPANGLVASPAFSANNGPIAFASTSTNLVYGAFSDTTGGAETFVTTEVKPLALPGVQAIGPAPPNPKIAPEWVISATVRRGRHGSVLLDVSVPGAGHLRATARAAVPVTKPRRRVSHRHAHRASSVATRTLASAAAAPRAAGVLELRLLPAVRYRALISRRHGLYATLTVRFVRAGRRALTETLPVDFLAPIKRIPKKAVKTW